MSGLGRSAQTNVGSWIEARARMHPDRVAVRVEATGEALTYADLDRLSSRVARFLRILGIRPGDRVALALRSEPLYLALYFAAARVGAILVPLNTRLTPSELAFQLADAAPALLVHDAATRVPSVPGAERLTRDELLTRLPQRDDAPVPAPGGEAPHVLMYTSGTAGVPKGALLPHRKTVFNTLNAEIYFALREGDVVVVPVPLFHSFGLKILSIPSLFAGATVVLVDRFDPLALQDTVSRHRATLIGCVPVMYQRMLAAGVERERLASLRMAFSAGSPLDPSVVHALHDLGVTLVQGYGQTETSILCCLDREHALSRAGSVGRPVHHGELRVVDEEGHPVGPGAAGEIVVGGPIVMLGYWRRPEETEAARLDGYHRTGDLAVVDDGGFVTLVGRLKELYISGGENVYPAEVERVFEGHPNVAECAVIGFPDPEWGESGRAYVVPVTNPLDPDDLLRFARERLARYKIPREIVVVSELPRTASGKIRKGDLAQLGER